MLAFFVALSLGASTPAAPAGLESASAARERAQEAVAELWAPTSFERGLRALEAAESERTRGAEAAQANATAAEAAQALSEAAATARAASQAFPLLHEARAAAQAVDAYLYARESWDQAQNAHRKTGAAFERGDRERADRHAGEAETRYRAAELAAIELRVLGEARAQVLQAERARAERHAPGALGEARAALSEAKGLLEADRYDTGRVAALADTAVRAARRALYVSERLRDGNAGIEALLLEWQQALARIAEAAGMDAAFDEDPSAPADALVEYIDELQARALALEREIGERNAQIRDLQSGITELEATLDGVALERSTLARELAEQERARAQFAQIENLFSLQEAEVFRERDELVIRLVGLSFPVGSATVQDTQHSLLDKVVEALSVFPSSDVTVEGHTDASGSSESNLALSRDRARNVREYLLQHSAISPTRIVSAGYGEGRPVASDETEAGRSKNRRIDVRIRPQLANAR